MNALSPEQDPVIWKKKKNKNHRKVYILVYPIKLILSFYY